MLCKVTITSGRGTTQRLGDWWHRSKFPWATHLTRVPLRPSSRPSFTSVPSHLVIITGHSLLPACRFCHYHLRHSRSSRVSSLSFSPFRLHIFCRHWTHPRGQRRAIEVAVSAWIGPRNRAMHPLTLPRLNSAFSVDGML
jgi:hypothetical protein